jgi:hypothetical protein
VIPEVGVETKPEIEFSPKYSPFIAGAEGPEVQDTDDPRFDKQFVSVCDQTMVGFVQQ